MAERAPGEALEADELELIEDADAFHEELASKGLIYDEPETQAFVERVGRQFIPPEVEGAVDIQFLLLRSGEVNAFALANGDIYVTLGFLSRVENEAQLAFTLAHEVSHILKRDHIAGLRSRRDTVVTAQIADLLLMGTGVAYLPAIAGLASYQRGQEARADEDGIAAVAAAGYDVRDLEGFFKIFATSERGVSFGGLFEDHPEDEARAKAASKAAQVYPVPEHLRELEDMLPMRQRIFAETCQLALRAQDYLRLRDWLGTVDPELTQNAEGLYFKGEAARQAAKTQAKAEAARRSSKKPIEPSSAALIEEARAAFDASLAAAPGNALALRGAGMLAMDTGDKEQARTLLIQYLETPECGLERRYIEYLLSQLDENQ